MAQERWRTRARSRAHPLLAKVRRALPRPDAAAGFLGLLERRLTALDAVAAGADARRLAARLRDEVCARRFLAARAGTWDDGDENLVRGFLDRWVRPEEDPGRAAARGLAEAARALAALEARPQTLWFFLWEMESILKDLGRVQSRRS